MIASRRPRRRTAALAVSCTLTAATAPGASRLGATSVVGTFELPA
ncbi:hypothetical protein ACFC6L_32430 [Kitasatospora phosalacinea]